MEKKSAKTAPSAAKAGKAGKNAPPKPAPKKRRFKLWLLLFMLIGGIAAMAGIYYRQIPVGSELTAKIEPYLAAVDPLMAKAGIQRKPVEETPPNGKPTTNFPLVELDGDKKKLETLPVAKPQADSVGKTAVAAASPGQPATGAVKAPVSETAEAQKTYAKLAKLYANMKADEAAAVFTLLEEDQVIMILSRMDEEAAAKVLSTLEPKKAARLTQAMIKRK